MSNAIPDANYYEFAPEVVVASWSPEPPGPLAKVTQVHLLIGTPPGHVALVRLKSAQVVDELIDALLSHREEIWGARK